ncbi:uncharacterized protein LOC143825650 [Paroedura picta]|uniref:uncharacterized protein LOC143825650 n=1 Tax=Paroedura picta TaxID=143630 RepID=UPI0040575897
MALDVVDAGVLKRNVVRLLLKHPQGIKVGDFTGAFYKLHGHHPQLALHGYSSLKNLLTDMNNMVVVEKNSQKTIIKLANGINHWLDEEEGWDNFEEAWDSPEEEMQNVRSEETENEEDLCDSASLDMDFSTDASVPQKMEGKKSVLITALLPILKILQDYPEGLKLQTLTQHLKKRGFDLERFSQDMDYGDAMYCLLDMPGLHLFFFNDITPDNCVVQLLSSSPGLLALPLSAGPSWHMPPSSSAVATASQHLMATKPGKKKKQKKGHDVQGKKTKSLAEVLELVTSFLNNYHSGLKVKKLQELLLTMKGFDLEKFSIAQGHKDTLEFLEHQMPQMPKLKIKYNENRLKCLVKQGPGVKSAPPLPHVQSRVESTKKVAPPRATPGVGGISKPLFREDTKAGPGASRLLQNGLPSGIPVPSAVIPKCPSSKEKHGASSGKEKSAPQPHSDIPAQQLNTHQLGGQSVTGKSSCPTYAQVLSQSSLTKPSQSEHQDELKQQVAHILARHPEGMSLFQFRAAYSTTYQNHLPLGNASSAKQRLLEMSDIVCVKGCGVQTLILPVSPEEPSTKPGPPVCSTVENAAMVVADSLPKAVVRKENAEIVVAHSLPRSVARPEPVVVSKPSLLRTPMEPQPHHGAHPPASDLLRAPDVKGNPVLPKGKCLTMPKVVAPLQEPVKPKVSFGCSPVSFKAEEVAKCLGNPLTEAAVTFEPVVVPKSSSKPSLSKTAAVPGSQLHPPVSSTSTCLGAPESGDKESPFLPESVPQTPPQPSVPVAEDVREPSIPVPGVNHFSPHSPVVFPTEAKVSHPDGFWTSDSLASTPAYLANPSLSVNMPDPSLFQPVLTNTVGMSEPVLYPPLAHLPDSPANPSLSSALSQSVPGAQNWQEAELLSSDLAPPASQNRPARPTTPSQPTEQTACTHAPSGLGPVESASRTQGQGCDRAPGFSADGLPVSSAPVQPPGLQPLNSPPVEQPENIDHTWLSSMPCSPVPAADGGAVVSPSTGTLSEPVAPSRQRQRDAVSAPATIPRIPSFTIFHQSACSSLSCAESHPVPSKPLASVPRPHYSRADSAATSSNAQPPSLLQSPQVSPISTSSQTSHVAFRPNTGYDASCQSRPLPGASTEANGQGNRHFALAGNQTCRHPEESAQPSPLQSSPPPRKSDNCIIL